MNVSNHARERMQQRGFNPLQSLLMEAMGCDCRAPGNATMEFLTQNRELRCEMLRAAKSLQRDLKHLAKTLGQNSGAYQIRSHDGNLLTMAHRYKSIRQSLNTCTQEVGL